MDIIFLLIVVLFIAYRVYNLGLEGNDDTDKVLAKPAKNNVVTKLEEAKLKVENKLNYVSSVEEVSEEHSDFNHDVFLRGARKVFELVVNAFSKGDLLIIKDLVSKKVFDAFSDALIVRKENNMTSEVDFICFDKSEIKEVKMLKNSVKVVVEFVSEQVNLLKNAEGEVVEGDENFVQKITDVWTFERSLNAKNNNWILVSTKKAV